MNQDFAIILNFKLNNDQIDYDALVKKARNIGVRAICGSDKLQEACQKYTIKLYPQAENGETLNKDNVIDTILANRKAAKATIINIDVDSSGKLNQETEQMLKRINSWMHMFGHALNEAAESELTVDQDGFILENRHANYQKYVFLKMPLPQEIIVSGLTQDPNRVEWIENRVDLDFKFKDGKLIIELTKPEGDFTWQVLRIQAHRPEDDIAETKF